MVCPLIVNDEYCQLKPGFEDIIAAYGRIKGVVVRTPVMEFRALNEKVGRRVFVKLEIMQHTGAFKFRGAMSKLTSLDADTRSRGVIAYSTGNHGMAVAEAARLMNIPAKIVVPLDTPEIKVLRMQESGAEISTVDRFKDNGEDVARQMANSEGRAFIHPFDDSEVIAGQGTLALEMIEQVADCGTSLDALLVNSAGGGFVSGCALACKKMSQGTKVISVECEAWDAIRRSLQSGRHEDNFRALPSICDAIQARKPGMLGYEIISGLLDHALAVSDEQALEAVRYAFERLRLVVEPGGAVGLAAVLSSLLPEELENIGIVLCGANVDGNFYANQVLQKAWGQG